MRSFVSFYKKEWLESQRSGKLLFLGILFLAFGIMNPAIAKLTPWLLEIFADEFAESGMVITEITVDAMTSWTQFFKNAPIALIAFLFLYATSFTREYEAGTLTLVLAGGLSRYKVVLAKASVILSVYTVGYFISFLVTYGYNAYFWDNSIAQGLFPSVFALWLFSILVLALMILFSTIMRTTSGVLLWVGGCVLSCYLLGFIPKISKFLPTALLDSAALLTGAKSIRDIAGALAFTVALILACLALSIPIFNKKHL